MADVVITTGRFEPLFERFTKVTVDMDASNADSKETQPVLESVPTPSRKLLPLSHAPSVARRANRRHVTAPAQALLGHMSASPKCADTARRSPPRGSVKVCHQASPTACVKPVGTERRNSNPSFNLPTDPASPVGPRSANRDTAKSPPRGAIKGCRQVSPSICTRPVGERRHSNPSIALPADPSSVGPRSVVNRDTARSPQGGAVKGCRQTSPTASGKPVGTERRHSNPTFGLPTETSPPAPSKRGMKSLRFQSSRSPSPQSHNSPDSPLAGPKPKARARSQSAPRRDGDPFNLYRFVDAQSENGTFSRALREIHAGRKSSCWMWFVIPSPPYMKNNIEHGSSTNCKYAIRSEQEGKAYLNYEADGVDLRSNYFAILSAVCEHLIAGKAARSVIGGFDEPKLASSIIFFERITRNEDNELNSLLLKLAGLMNLQLTA